MELIVSIVKAIAALLPFTSQFGLVKYICSQSAIFGIAWIDKALFWIASALATGVAVLVVRKTDLPGKAKAGISIMSYMLILSLFASKVFWLVILGIIVVAATCAAAFGITKLRSEKQ